MKDKSVIDVGQIHVQCQLKLNLFHVSIQRQRHTSSWSLHQNGAGRQQVRHFLKVFQKVQPLV